MAVISSTTRKTFPTNRPLLLRFADWMIERDRHYREKTKLANLPSHRLADMGLTRDDIDRMV